MEVFAPSSVERFGGAVLLAVNATPIRNESAKLFTSSYDNFIQTAGIRDGASHYTKILSVFYDNLDTSNPNDPDVIIKIDVSNAFNSTDRALTLDMISGRTSRDYACGIKEVDVIGTVDSLTNLFGYLKTCAHSTLKVSLALVYLLVRTPLYRVLWLKNVGIS
jgi:hypothetical protein